MQGTRLRPATVEWLVEEGTVASYADAARQLGVSRARITQLVNLLN